MKKNFLFGLCALMLSQSTFIHAQNVEEVIVTATKTERTLQEVPVAVSVVTADTIEKANVVDLLDLKAVVPSLRCKTVSINH